MGSTLVLERPDAQNQPQPSEDNEPLKKWRPDLQLWKLQLQLLLINQ